MWVYKILERAIAESKSSWFLGKNILGSGFDLELYVHWCRCLHLWRRNCFDRIIGGKRNPRIKPLLFRDCGQTNVVNNVETIASVPWIVNNSGDDYAKIELVGLQEPN
jgi:NADH-quinone oxidoreductase subunit F